MDRKPLRFLKMKEDILTGFFTREELIPYVSKLIELGSNFSLGLMDLDGFKKYNDEYGHLFGDEILKYVASTIKLTVANAGVIFRYGGDEFIIIIQKRDKKYVSELFKKCNSNMQKRPFLYKNRFFKMTASYGIVDYPHDAQDVKALIGMADRAMYFAKKTGKGKILSAKGVTIKRFMAVFKMFIIIAVFTFGSVYVFNNSEELKSKVLAFTKKDSKIEELESSVFTPYLGKVTLKNGLVFKGGIVGEDSETVVVRILIDEEIGKVRIDKNLILEIR
ncbi:MAG: GGDEF domain-containing protein [Candidatus Saelkia tenebricola]|nr:GGDEF domain-containing protein [Candidatus Saelkia tenebricola]